MIIYTMNIIYANTLTYILYTYYTYITLYIYIYIYIYIYKTYTASFHNVFFIYGYIQNDIEIFIIYYYV